MLNQNQKWKQKCCLNPFGMEVEAVEKNWFHFHFLLPLPWKQFNGTTGKVVLILLRFLKEYFLVEFEMQFKKSLFQFLSKSLDPKSLFHQYSIRSPLEAWEWKRSQKWKQTSVISKMEKQKKKAPRQHHCLLLMFTLELLRIYQEVSKQTYYQC